MLNQPKHNSPKLVSASLVPLHSFECNDFDESDDDEILFKLLLFPPQLLRSCCWLLDENVGSGVNMRTCPFWIGLCKSGGYVCVNKGDWWELGKVWSKDGGPPFETVVKVDTFSGCWERLWMEVIGVGRDGLELANVVNTDEDVGTVGIGMCLSIYYYYVFMLYTNLSFVF